MLVVSTWPLLKSLQARLGNRRAPAVALMTLGLLLLLILPLWAAIDTIARHADEVTALAKTVAESGLPQPPAWVRGRARRRREGRGRLGATRRKPARTASSPGWRPTPRTPWRGCSARSAAWAACWSTSSWS